MHRVLITLALTAALVVTAMCSVQQLDTREAIPYFIQDGAGVPGFIASDRELAVWALSAWSRESNGKLKFVQAKGPDDAMIRVHWISPNEGLFGETEHFRFGDKIGAIVHVMPAVSQLGDPLAGRAVADKLLRDAVVYLTCVHELGHAVGLPHTREFQDIMYSFGYGGDIAAYFMRYRDKLKSREDIARNSGLSASDVVALRAIYK